MTTPVSSVKLNENQNNEEKSIKFKNHFEGRVFRFIHHHPTFAKVTILALGILFFPVVSPTLIIGSIGITIYALRKGYSFKESLCKPAGLASSLYHLIFPAKHNMNTHVFTEGEWKGCTLKYDGNVPVLNITNAQTPDEAGYAQGYLLAEAMKKLLNRWNGLLWLAMPKQDKTEQLCTYLKNTVPQYIQEEIKGAVRGFNEKMTLLGYKERITFEEVLLFHLVPDILHSEPDALAKKIIPPHGCSAILDTDEKNLPMLGRNMDWPSLGLAGKQSLMLKRRIGEKNILEIATPGLFGTVTGMSSSMAIAMNVCEGETQNKQNGLPACILNRMILDACETIDEVDEFVKKTRPIGPYHLSIADKEKAKSYHFYQGKDAQDHMRTISKHAPIITTNCRYNDEGAYRHYFSSKEREKNIRLHYSNFKDKKNKVEGALKVPLVNNHETVHHVLMYPCDRKMKVVFDNAYAGDKSMHSLML